MEVLLALTILGVLLGILTSTLVSTQRITTQQSTTVDAGQAIRLALLRVNEIATQASYIYPSGRTLQFAPGEVRVTGPELVAFLLPRGTTYCPGVGTTYCGVAYSIEDRAPHESLLGPGGHTTGRVLVERRAVGIDWNRGTVPTLLWGPTTDGIVADSVDPTDTNLGDDLDPATTLGTFDQLANFTIADTMSERSLVGSVNVRVAVRYDGQHSVTMARESLAFARNLPRFSLPNPN